MEFVEFLQSWGVPAGIVTGILLLIAFLNFIYFLMDKGGKTVTGFLNIYKWFKDRRQQKQDLADFLKEIKGHYCPENIEKRNDWMDWVNDRATMYDKAVDELKALESVFQVNNKLTEDMYIQSCRTQIINFSYRVRDPQNRYRISRDEFDNIYEVYEDYEAFNRAHNRVNGKVDRAKETIDYHYHEYDQEHYFSEDTDNTNN